MINTSNYNKQNTIVIDNGTGFTKMGYAQNLEPDFVIPTSIAELDKKSNITTSNKTDEFNYAIGNEADILARESKKHALFFPMQHGLVDNWDAMEKFWHSSIHHYLKADPQEHNFVLTEPPMNPPENRENVAEIFFETFNCAGLYIGVQATFALIGCNYLLLNDLENEKSFKDEVSSDQVSALKSMTGIVIDSGDGVTHVVPVCDGYVLGSNIKHVPIAGRRITNFIKDMIKERGEKIDIEDSYFAARQIKEMYGYLCKNLCEEFGKFDSYDVDNVTGLPKLSSKFKKYKGIGYITKNPINIDLGYEVFMGPEAFFSPEIIDKNHRTPIDEIVDLTIQSCPIDYRRRLYSNIVLSGGSTHFKNFDKRLEKTVQARADERLKKYESNDHKPKKINVNVANTNKTKHTVWLGGSTFASGPNFGRSVHTREEYLEVGPSCCRFNPVFGM